MLGFIRPILLAGGKFMLQIAFGQFHRIHRRESVPEEWIFYWPRNQVDDQLGHITRTVMVLSDFRD